MASSVPKLALSRSRDIPFDRLVLSQANVRRLKCGVSIGELADDIMRRTLLSSLNVRAVLDDQGNDTGKFEVPAGGRRFRALELLVNSKRMAKTQPVPCIIREGGSAEEDSLAENTMRLPLHPLDQFLAFKALRDAGTSEEEIAARFYAPVNIIKQRLRLASVSDALLDIYGEDGMTLDQLMAFSVSSDHARQEHVWANSGFGQHIQPHAIRRMLTEDSADVHDRRAIFVGIAAYEAAGGYIRSDIPGQITAQVTQNVYDSPTGQVLLIPQGARLIGEYDSDIPFGQYRVLLAWNRLILPDGRSVLLDRQPGADAAGFAGLQDGVNYHWGSLAKAALISTVLGVGAELGSGSNDALTRALRTGTQDTINQFGQQIVRRQLNVTPTLTIRPGFPVRVIVTKDMILAPIGERR